jgi:GT2 family glycosyltransferase
MLNITVTVSTKDRYFTTLPLCLTAVANQSYKPQKIVIYDDGEQKDLREEPIYKNIFSLFDKKEINWCVLFGKKEGQIKNHQHALYNSETEYIWRLDDDNVPEYNVLESLVNTINLNDDIGAVSCLVLDPKHNFEYNINAKNTIEQLKYYPNLQWFRHPYKSYIDVEHIYSTFLYKKEAGKHGYDMRLSPAGFREETLFTYEMIVNGWRLVIDTGCIIWHYTTGKGGIKSFPKEMYERDEIIFDNRMNELNSNNDNSKFIVLDCGLGDHFAFKSILDKIKEKYNDKEIIIACCYPEVFKDTSNVKLISIAEAKIIKRDIEKYDIYKFMGDNMWNKSIVEAFIAMYL